MNVLRMKRPSPAFVVAMVALFVALGGTAGAVVTHDVPDDAVVAGVPARVRAQEAR